MNLFALPPGVDFVVELIKGVEERIGPDPIALARSEIWVNTERTRRRLIEVFNEGPARLLPKIRLVTELSPLFQNHLPNGVTALQRRLELYPKISNILERRPALSTVTSTVDLGESLAKLFGEMADEGVLSEALMGLDIEDASGHWQNNLEFLTILSESALTPDHASLQRAIAENIADNWAKTPPDFPIFMAGSTGSRGPVAILMRALLSCDSGHVILPGFDFESSASNWEAFGRTKAGEDHPQFRFWQLAQSVGINPSEILRWTDKAPPAPDRNQLLSLALRPAPVTDGWTQDGPKLGSLEPICSGISLIEAKTPRQEAMAIAARLRESAENGKSAALITPDRRLSRRVRAALDQWGIIPDDSAGTALTQTPQGNLFMTTSRILGKGIESEDLVAILSNPLTASGANRKDHLTYVRDLEGYLRRNAVGRPSKTDLQMWADDFGGESEAWTLWLLDLVAGLETVLASNLTTIFESHFSIVEALAIGPGDNPTSDVWGNEAGQEVQKALRPLGEHGKTAAWFDLGEYDKLLGHLLSQVQVRDATTPHPQVMIWGTLEARVQSVDVAILAGLNEGVWPKSAEPDPWLSRQMRERVGLLSPERRIGLSAHDFQSAAGAAEVIFSRSVRDEDAMTVPSRWLNRLTNLLAGLPDQGGSLALEQMQERGARWIAVAQALDARLIKAAPAPRPSPAPPKAARPRRLSVTQIKTLVRDPYAIYASRVLDLSPLEPLRPEADARVRGIIVHRIFERFLRAATRDPRALSDQALLTISDEVLGRAAEWPKDQRLWMSNLKGLTNAFISEEQRRWKVATPAYFELKGAWNFTLPSGDHFTLSGIADRVDVGSDGRAWIFDYKTGVLPTKLQQVLFDKQLYLLSLMVEEGAFSDGSPVPPMPVAGGGYLGVGRKLSNMAIDQDAFPAAEVLSDLHALLSAYLDPDQGFSSRAKMEKSDRGGDYDHLARMGEWGESAPTTFLRVAL